MPDPTGGYVVVWTDWTVNATTNAITSAVIMGQEFDQYGRAVNQQFQVNTVTGFSYTPAVAMDPNGDFVVVWAGDGPNLAPGIWARLYSSFGTPLTDPFQVNSYLEGTETNPSVAMDGKGNFEVTWTCDDTGRSVGGSTTTADNIYMRRFNNQGVALDAGDILVNTTVAGAQDESNVAMDQNGNFVVVWQSYGQDGSGWGVDGRQFTAAETPITGEFQVNVYTTNNQFEPKVAMDANGDFVVTWSSFGQDAGTYGIYARRYFASGPGTAGVVQGTADELVNQTTVGQQGGTYLDPTFGMVPNGPSVGMANNGSYEITWSAFTESTVGNLPITDFGIFARAFNKNGTSYVDPTSGQTTGEYHVNASDNISNFFDDIQPAIAVSPAGAFGVTWVGMDDTAIFARFWGPPVTPAAASGPTISSVQFALSGNPPVVTWAAADPNGLGAMTLQVDGKTMTTIYGPYGTKTAADYAGALGTLAAGTHTFVITATNTAGTPVTSTYSGSFTVSASSTGATISNVVVALNISQPVITWSAADTAGISTASLQVDGKAVTTIYGPYGTSTAANYAGALSSLSAGTHTYVITVTGATGAPVQYTGSFTVAGSNPAPTNPGPTISNVTLALTANPPVITWSAADSNGLGAMSLTVDGKVITTIYGPYGSSTAANYAGALSGLSAGTHTYVIYATDTAATPVTSQHSGSFTVAGSNPVPTNPGPTISNVTLALSGNPPVITWSAADSNGLGAMSLTVDGKAITTIYGPYGSSTAANYAGALSGLSAGTHSYVIYATDTATSPVTSQYTGSFTVTGSSPAPTNPGPTISNVDVALSANPPVITWSAADSNGLGPMGLTVDGKTMTTIYGPYGSSTAANYAGALGGLSAGTHSYVIYATDTAASPATSQYTGSFNVAALTAQGPAITNIVIESLSGGANIQSNSQIIVSWTLTDSAGIFATNATIDGVSATALYGPYGSNYSATFNPMSAGTHTVTITAADNSSAHSTSQQTQTFSVAQVATAAVLAQAAATSQQFTAKADWLINVQHGKLLGDRQ